MCIRDRTITSVPSVSEPPSSSPVVVTTSRTETIAGIGQDRTNIPTLLPSVVITTGDDGNDNDDYDDDAPTDSSTDSAATDIPTFSPTTADLPTFFRK